MKPCPPKTILPSILALLATAFIGGCGGNGGNATTPTPVVIVPPQPVELDFSTIKAEIDRHSVTDMAILIGDAEGILLSYEKGSFETSDIVELASATKFITGLGVWSLIQEESLAESDFPQDYIDFWTSDMNDIRSAISLSQLMSFTSGFNTRPFAGGCQGDENFTLRECVNESYVGDVDTNPGEAFSYGPEHMQIAALMSREATGLELQTTIRRDLLDPVGASSQMAFPDEEDDNPRYSGGMRASANDYALVLTSFLAGDLISGRDNFLLNRTMDIPTAYTLPALGNNQVDWHYGFGFWIECDVFPFQEECNDAPVISSPGAFGFLPWVDLENGYWAILAMQEPIGFGRSPSTDSVELEQILQPMILDVLDR